MKTIWNWIISLFAGKKVEKKEADCCKQFTLLQCMDYGAVGIQKPFNGSAWQYVYQTPEGQLIAEEKIAQMDENEYELIRNVMIGATLNRETTINVDGTDYLLYYDHELQADEYAIPENNLEDKGCFEAAVQNVKEVIKHLCERQLTSGWYSACVGSLGSLKEAGEELAHNLALLKKYYQPLPGEKLQYKFQLSKNSNKKHPKLEEMLDSMANRMLLVLQECKGDEDLLLQRLSHRFYNDAKCGYYARCNEELMSCGILRNDKFFKEKLYHVSKKVKEEDVKEAQRLGGNALVGVVLTYALINNLLEIRDIKEHIQINQGLIYSFEMNPEILTSAAASVVKEFVRIKTIHEAESMLEVLDQELPLLKKVIGQVNALPHIWMLKPLWNACALAFDRKRHDIDYCLY